MRYHKKFQTFIFIIDEEFEGKTIYDFFITLHFSRKTIHLLQQEKKYQLNHQYVPIDTILKKKDQLAILDNNKKIPIDPIYYPLEVLYEDDVLCIINKPSNIIIHDDGNNQNTLNQYVASYYQMNNQTCPVIPIHRLDKDTSGIIIYCKSKLLQPLFDHMMKEKRFKRTYFAFVEGNFDDYKEHTIKTCLAKDRHNSKKMRVASKGIEAITHYQMLFQADDYAGICCKLETGRKHQIRVHLSNLKHPILQDVLYGKHSLKCNRLALHSWKLSFIHPLTKEQIHITCDLPDDLRHLVI